MVLQQNKTNLNTQSRRFKFSTQLLSKLYIYICKEQFFFIGTYICKEQFFWIDIYIYIYMQRAINAETSNLNGSI